MSTNTRAQGRPPRPDLFEPPDEPRRVARAFDVAQAVRGVWHSGVDPAGTLTEQYIATLGLPLTDDARGQTSKMISPSLS
jgi:hypothetical protein